MEYEGRRTGRANIISYQKQFLTCCLVEKEAPSDIRDLEFSMANNIKNLKSRAALFSTRNVDLIKLILCSALYPQLAVGDEHNPYRKSNELLFHTPGMSLPVARINHHSPYYPVKGFSIDSPYQCHRSSPGLGAGRRK